MRRMSFTFTIMLTWMWGKDGVKEDYVAEWDEMADDGVRTS